MSWWTHRTKTGRIIYDRKPHAFRWRDVLRILDPLPVPDGEDDQSYWFSLVLLDVLEKAVESGFWPEIELAEARETVLAHFSAVFADFGQGEFGGGGADRTFGDGDPAVRAPGESPFALGPCGVPWFVRPIQPC